MSFSCKNYDYNSDQCRKLKAECIPGRRGCVLEGRITVSEKLAEKLAALDNAQINQPANQNNNQLGRK